MREICTYGLARGRPFLDFAPDFVLAFRFDDIGRAGRLDQEIDLATAASRVALIAIGGGGDDDAVAEMQMGVNLPEVVDDQVQGHASRMTATPGFCNCLFRPTLQGIQR